MDKTMLSPLFACKDYAAPSIFTVEHLLEGARSQKGLLNEPVPQICIFDPDGDLVEYLRATQRSTRLETWACYHTQMDIFTHEGQQYGIIGCVVGASFAVLVAEELFASGCECLISITSAGQIMPIAEPPYFVLIEAALRDEGTSYHYLPPSPYSKLHPYLHSKLRRDWRQSAHPLHFGRSWTTDAPFRETANMVAYAREQGIAAVEMEAAALYALATSQNRDIICFAHITNQLGQGETDFEKGPAQGSLASLAVVQEATRIWQTSYAAQSVER